MNGEQKMVREFHRTFEIDELDKPGIPSERIRDLRISLLDEEYLKELRPSLLEGDLLGIADGLADLLYVVYGTALAYGLDLEPIFQEVHRSNMSKVGGYKREDGKWIKPSTYSPANLRPLLEWQRESAGAPQA